LKENDYLLEELKEHVSLTYDLLFPVILVLDEIVSKDFKISDLSKNEATDLFNEGYDYLYNSLDIIKSFLDKTFENNTHELLAYDKNVYETIKLEELDSILENKNEDLSNTINLLYQSVEQKRILAQEEIEYIDKLVDSLLKEEDYLPIPDKYIEIADELGLDLL
jgi:hypothetical protein